MPSTWARLVLGRGSIRAKVGRTIAQRTDSFPYETRIEYGTIARPHYGYCVLHAARLASRLGHDRMSVLEFGVAGGNGLVDLEMHAELVRAETGITIETYGFDAGSGLPAPIDYRDLPHQWQAGFFRMDREALERRLSSSRLVIGNVKDTIASFVEAHRPAPIGAVMMDLDYYSSTVDAFALFDQHRDHLLPRAFVYFDDILGDATSLFSEHTGVRLAINEFNAQHDDQKLDRTTYLVEKSPFPEPWHHQIYVYHDFSHEDYNRFVAAPGQQLPLQDHDHDGSTR